MYFGGVLRLDVFSEIDELGTGDRICGFGAVKAIVAGVLAHQSVSALLDLFYF